MTKLLCVFSLSLVLAIPGAAQEPKSMTMLALFKVKYGKTGDFIANANKIIVPALDKLMKDGVIDSYGIDADMLHVAGLPNLAAWYTVSSYAKVQKATEAVTAAQRSNPAEAQKMLDACDMDAHQDLLLEMVAGKFGKAPAGAMPFTSVSFIKLKPGKGPDWEKSGNQYFKPLYDKLVDDGVIYGYQVMQQAVHAQEATGRWIVVVMPDLAAMDKVNAAFEQMMKSRSASERSMMQGSTRDTTDESAHRDYLMSAIAFKTK